jgi:hypothetical protein
MCVCEQLAAETVIWPGGPTLHPYLRNTYSMWVSWGIMAGVNDIFIAIDSLNYALRIKRELRDISEVENSVIRK